MKKIISVLLFIISVAGILFSKCYTKWPIDYHIANFIGYITLWSIALFVLSILALILNNDKYKKYAYFTIIYVILSIFLAYLTGDGNGGILSIDGELVTWFLVGLYSLVSVIFLIIQFIKSKKQIQNI